MPAMPTRPQSAVNLSACIVLHNNELAMVQKTLSSLKIAAARASASGILAALQLYIVDNSTDLHRRRQFQQVFAELSGDSVLGLHYVAAPYNKGFGAGHNSVLSKIDSDFHLILNPDVELFEDALEVALCRMQAEPEVILLSPRVISLEGQPEFLCKRYPTVLTLLLRAFAPAFLRRLFQRRLDHYEMRDSCGGDAEVEVPLASGCFMLIRTGALRVVGGFDERFFLYFEDFDLSLRLAGQGRFVFYPTARIVHHGGYAASKGFQHIRFFVRSGILFFRKHGWRWL